MTFGLMISAVIFLAVALGVATLGLRMWIRPKEAIERVAGVGVVGEEAPPSHPSLAFRELLVKLGNYVPQSPKDVTVMQRRLIRAGYRNQNVLTIFYGAKLL